MPCSGDLYEIIDGVKRQMVVDREREVDRAVRATLFYSCFKHLMRRWDKAGYVAAGAVMQVKRAWHEQHAR